VEPQSTSLWISSLVKRIQNLLLLAYKFNIDQMVRGGLFECKDMLLDWGSKIITQGRIGDYLEEDYNLNAKGVFLLI